MSSLLNLTIKEAHYSNYLDGARQANTFVVVKLKNAKTITNIRKGQHPCWGEDFVFEMSGDISNQGLLIEVWAKGFLVDNAIGFHLVPLDTVRFSNEESIGQWVELHGEVVWRDGAVAGTVYPTGHFLLYDCRLELPYGPGDSHFPTTEWKTSTTTVAAITNTSTTNTPVMAAAMENKVSKDASKDQSGFQQGLRTLKNMLTAGGGGGNKFDKANYQSEQEDLLIRNVSPSLPSVLLAEQCQSNYLSGRTTGFRDKLDNVRSLTYSSSVCDEGDYNSRSRRNQVDVINNNDSNYYNGSSRELNVQHQQQKYRYQRSFDVPSSNHQKSAIATQKSFITDSNYYSYNDVARRKQRNDGGDCFNKDAYHRCAGQNDNDVVGKSYMEEDRS